LNIAEMAKQNAKKITQQWVQASIFEALSECAMCRPDFEVSVSALGNQGNIYLARMVFHNCGNTLFTSRLLNFALIAMRDHYKGPHFAATPVTSQPESAPEQAPEPTTQETSN
jgi:hypothetical protein